ncbi:hypothetical protein CYMTET_32853 [Cymbomonas tetramitiformis]|uniref:Uncharacterized protein n=1 Tax=Cymbomonas tetramitiformis TaxID=36881 RepID=A0AAE0KRF9_9CHLO|nr:hypothetical protein CYMTET_32853 [Cymbomonas tetramitiformis]
MQCQQAPTSTLENAQQGFLQISTEKELRVATEDTTGPINIELQADLNMTNWTSPFKLSNEAPLAPGLARRVIIRAGSNCSHEGRCRIDGGGFTNFFQFLQADDAGPSGPIVLNLHRIWLAAGSASKGGAFITSPGTVLILRDSVVSGCTASQGAVLSRSPSVASRSSSGRFLFIDSELRGNRALELDAEATLRRRLLLNHWGESSGGMGYCSHAPS